MAPVSVIAQGRLRWALPRSSRLTPSLRALVREALALEGKRPGAIAIVLTDDAEVRELNRRYRGIDRATDVLSFPYGERGVYIPTD